MPEFPSIIKESSCLLLGVTKHGVITLNQTASVFSHLRRIQETRMNTCILFCSSFRCVKSQVTHLICQSYHRGWPKKKQVSSLGVAELSLAPSSHLPICNQFFNFFFLRQLKSSIAAHRMLRKDLIFSLIEWWRIQDASGCQTQLDSVCIILPRQVLDPQVC